MIHAQGRTTIMYNMQSDWSRLVIYVSSSVSSTFHELQQSQCDTTHAQGRTTIVRNVQVLFVWSCYGLATISRRLKIIDVLCKRAL